MAVILPETDRWHKRTFGCILHIVKYNVRPGVNEMNQKLPYYMAYPMPLAYDDERVERMDLEYMKSLYPALAKRLLPYIEEECDRMEYGNSVIYDEYPDRLQLRMMCGRIYENVRKNEERYLEIEKDAQLKDLIELMLYQELYNRRCRNRRTRNQFYINGSF